MSIGLQRKFSIGDIVQLKSGGPAMTVTSHQEPDKQERLIVWAVWFVDGEVKSANFAEETLDLSNK